MGQPDYGNLITNNDPYYNECLKERYTAYLKDHLSGAKTEVLIQAIDLNEYVQNSIRLAKNYLHSTQVKVSYKINGDHIFYSNPYYLRFIFDQLIENGLIFHDKLKYESFLDIELNIEKDQLTIDVVDNGIGVPKKYLSKIFQMFSCYSNKSKGFGIGLALIKKFVNKMYGSIYFDSALGVGSHVKIRIPNTFYHQ